jgi:hypothetical protein
MRRAVTGAIALGLICGTASALEPPRKGQEDSLSRAVFGGGRLWLLSDAGELWSVAPGEKVRVPSKLTDPVLDVCTSGGVVRVLTCPREGCSAWTLRHWSKDGWSTDGTIPTTKDKAAAISCDSSGATLILTEHRLIDTAERKATPVALSGDLHLAAVTSIHATANAVFVGINAGEWGGGLRRIDRKTGAVTIIEKTTTDRCSGPLSTVCDPVNGIADDPWKPGCIAAAIGLVHFSPHGRIVEICGARVERLYFHQFPPPKGRDVRAPAPEDDTFDAEAFFGLVRVGKSLVAVGLDGLYRFDGPGAPTRTPLPAFEDVGNIRVSFAIPDVILVLTTINQRRSVSGAVPMLVAR